MTALISRAAVLEIIRTPAASDTFSDMIRRVEALDGCGVRVKALEPVAQPEPGPGELLPCPFCGGEAEMRGFSTNHFVVCTDCLTTSDDRSAERAATAWNRRATREPGTETTPGQFETMCLAIEDVITGRGFDVDPWQPIETAPKDGTWILARYADTEDDRRQHWPGRIFVVKHMGYTAGRGYDMGWALFPGMGVGDESLSHWMPLPKPPGEATSVIPEEVKAYMRNVLMVGGWRGERE